MQRVLGPGMFRCSNRRGWIMEAEAAFVIAIICGSSQPLV